MKHVYTFQFFIFLASFSGCNVSPDFTYPFVENHEAVKNTITNFFNNYNGNYRLADTTYLSYKLNHAISKAIAEEKKSVLEVKASRYPSDKPKILEGEVFSGLYEGFTAFSVKEVTMLNDTMASSEILFANHYYNEKWTDSIVLINENGWKIDNVYFNRLKHKPILNSVQLLDSFIVN